VPEQSTNIERELRMLEAELKRLEAEYNMFFAGRLPRPPWETRSRVEGIVKRLDRTPLTNYGDRFRFSTLQSRYVTFIELWDRGLRAREEGRSGPFAHTRSTPAATTSAPEDRTVHVTTFRDPGREIEKVRDLYDHLADARRVAGQENVPFHKFVELVSSQVAQLKEKGTSEVAFRVAMKDGKVSFTARPMKGTTTDE
jgi:hypothetical protein